MTTATSAEAGFRTLSIEMLDGGIAVVTFDLPGEPVNKFSRQAREDFAALIERAERDRAIRGVVLVSGKPDTFIAGADIEEFLELRSAEEAERLSSEGHRMLDRLELLDAPVVAAIHGACLGGGLEAALACHWRIATDHPKTVLALPEVQLGLVPGGGGTQRLPEVVGLRAALDMMLTGKNVRAKKALQMGLVDELVHPAILREIAVRRARELADGTRRRSRGRRKAGLAGTVLDESGPGRAVVFRQARAKTLAKTKGHYPAPLAILDAVQAHYAKGREQAYANEAWLFGQMAMSDVARQLIFIFFASTALRKDPGVEPPVPETLPIEKIGILGAGFMGAGIASVAVQQGTIVRLKDADLGRVGKGLAAVRDVLEGRLERKQITRQQFEDMMVLAGGAVDYSGFGNVDMVIEAVFEDLAVKHQVLRETEQVVREDAIFASNTSTIPIAQIARAAGRPDRVIGMHFFSPVHRMPLLEVIVTDEVDRQVTATTVAYGKKLGKTVIVVRDGPGFYVNRILSPYINEAGKLLDQGAPVDGIDRALVEFGFPVGPITLVDEVGIDIAGKSGRIISEAFGERLQPSTSLQRVVEAGRTGRKGRKGFYLYDAEGKKGSVDVTVYDEIPGGRQRIPVTAEEIQERTVFAMLNEAARCLEEGVIRSPRDGDIGAVFGFGFPPFRGGPFRYMDTLGVAQVVETLRRLDARFAPRFAPAQLLVDMARSGERFYPAEGKPVG